MGHSGILETDYNKDWEEIYLQSAANIRTKARNKTTDTNTSPAFTVGLHSVHLKS